MKNAIPLILFMFAGCERKPPVTTYHTVTIVEVARSNYVVGNWKTTVEFADGTRCVLDGKRGKVGESFQWKEVTR